MLCHTESESERISEGYVMACIPALIPLCIIYIKVGRQLDLAKLFFEAFLCNLSSSFEHKC